MSELCIILTAEQAARGWGGSRKGTALRPVLLADGETYVLPARVLEKTAHAAHHGFLKTLPKREIADSEFPRAEDAPQTAPSKSR